MRTRILVAVVAVAIAVTGGAAFALNLGEALLKTVATGVIVKAVAKPADKGINTLLMNNHVPCGTDTKVVPVLSVGEKGYVGMAQVAGARSLVDKTESVVQFETAFSDKQYRIKLLMPMNSVNPIGVSRVQGLGVSALIDMALSHNAYKLPPSEGWNAGDVLKAAAIGVAASKFGPQIDGFINTVYKAQGGTPKGQTKVVPYLSFGTKSYIGMMQVAGPASQVRKVKAVWQFEQLFDSGRIRLRALVPTDTVNPLKLRRVSGVGCTAVIDAMLLRAKEEQRYPSQYRYFESAPVFVGADEDPHYHRPRGWDRGEKVGWAQHGNPYLPPGQAREREREVVAPAKDDGRISIGDILKQKDKDKKDKQDEDNGRGRGRRHNRYQR
jgi:hypothetical protein